MRHKASSLAVKAGNIHFNGLENRSESRCGWSNTTSSQLDPLHTLPFLRPHSQHKHTGVVCLINCHARGQQSHRAGDMRTSLSVAYTGCVCHSQLEAHRTTAHVFFLATPTPTKSTRMASSATPPHVYTGGSQVRSHIRLTTITRLIGTCSVGVCLNCVSLLHAVALFAHRKEGRLDTSAWTCCQYI